MWFFTVLFGGLMLLSASSRRRVIAIFLIGCIALLGVPPPAEDAHSAPRLRRSPLRMKST